MRKAFPNNRFFAELLVDVRLLLCKHMHTGGTFFILDWSLCSTFKALIATLLPLYLPSHTPEDPPENRGSSPVFSNSPVMICEEGRTPELPHNSCNTAV
jgi:hypothetical protein